MKGTTRALRVGVDVRISDDREGAGLGVKRRENDCRLLAASLDWTVVRLYDDNDMSAPHLRKKRKGYHRLMADIENGHIDAVIAWHPDRLYRQPRGLEDLMGLLDSRDLDVELRTVTAGAVKHTTSDEHMPARIQVAIAKTPPPEDHRRDFQLPHDLGQREGRPDDRRRRLVLPGNAASAPLRTDRRAEGAQERGQGEGRLAHGRLSKKSWGSWSAGRPNSKSTWTRATVPSARSRTP